MSAVAFDDVSIALGGTGLLAGASFSIGEGEFIGVLGPNGAGKTTLMRAVLGLIPVQSGSITVFGAATRRGLPGIG